MLALLAHNAGPVDLAVRAENPTPVMLSAADLLRDRMGSLTVLVSQAPFVNKGAVARIVRSHPGVNVELVDGPVREVFERSRMVVAASGTVTLEAAIACVPTVIVYKLSPLSFRLGKAMVRVSYAGLANLIAGGEVQPVPRIRCLHTPHCSGPRQAPGPWRQG